MWPGKQVARSLLCLLTVGRGGGTDRAASAHETLGERQSREKVRLTSVLEELGSLGGRLEGVLAGDALKARRHGKLMRNQSSRGESKAEESRARIRTNLDGLSSLVGLRRATPTACQPISLACFRPGKLVHMDWANAFANEARPAARGESERNVQPSGTRRTWRPLRSWLEPSQSFEPVDPQTRRNKARRRAVSAGPDPSKVGKGREGDWEEPYVSSSHVG
jgi:hypothetical protein